MEVITINFNSSEEKVAKLLEIKEEVKRQEEGWEKEKAKYDELIEEQQKEMEDMESAYNKLNIRIKESSEEYEAISIRNVQLEGELEALGREIRRKEEESSKMESDMRLYEYKFDTMNEKCQEQGQKIKEQEEKIIQLSIEVATKKETKKEEAKI